MSGDIIEQADRFLQKSPHSYAAPLVCYLRDDLAKTESKLSRVLSSVSEWVERHKNAQQHAPVQARVIHDLAMDDLILRIVVALEGKS
jgi:hypothetical protein